MRFITYEYQKIVSWGASEMQGWRTSQEDAYIIHKIELPDGT